MNTHESLPAQYWHYLGDMAGGNFGTSLFFFPSPVGQVVRAAIPWTLCLVGVTTILAFILGTGAGGPGPRTRRRRERGRRGGTSSPRGERLPAHDRARWVATTMNVCAAAGFGVVDMAFPFDGG